MDPLRPAPSAVIFDLDGVLLDTEPLYTRAAQAVVAPFGKQYDWSLKSKTMGTDALEGARRVIDTLELPLTPEQYVTRRNKELETLFLKTPAIAGAEAWVKALAKTGIPLAIATSSESALCALKWVGNEWLNQIPVKLHGDSPGIERLKPWPDIYLAAAKALNIQPSSCLVFEDSPAGVEAAKRAGMRVVALKARELAAELVQQADRVIESYADISLDALSLATPSHKD